MEKTNRRMKVLVVFLLIVIIALSAFIVYDKALKGNDINNKKDNTEVTKPKVEKLDVNSDFVQSLYSKVFYGDVMGNQDIFSDDVRFTLAKKMLKATEIQKIPCSQVSSEIKLKANEGEVYQAQCGYENDITEAISYDVLQKYAHEIYGKGVILSKSTVMDCYQPGCNRYIYDSDMNSFILFNYNCGNHSDTDISYSLSSATKEGSKVYII